jgi:hypothetical protein
VFCCCYGALTALAQSSAASGETQIIKYTRPRALLPIYIKYGVAPFTLNSPFKPRLPEFLQSPRRLFYARRLLSLRTPTALRISMPYTTTRSNSSKHTRTSFGSALLSIHFRLACNSNSNGMVSLALSLGHLDAHAKAANSFLGRHPNLQIIMIVEVVENVDKLLCVSHVFMKTVDAYCIIYGCGDWRSRSAHIDIL